MKVISYQKLFGHNQQKFYFLIPYTITINDKHYLPYNVVKKFGYLYWREWIEEIDV